MRAWSAAALMLALAGCIGREVVGERGSASEPECMQSPPVCDGAAEIPALAPIGEDAFDVPSVPCSGSPSMDELPGGPDAALRCAEVTVDLVEGATVELRGAELENVRLWVRGGAGATVRIADSTVRDLYVEVEGHAWLVIAEGSVVDGLVFDADPTMEGSVLTVADSHVTGFALRTAGRGAIRLEGSELESGILDAGDLVSVDTVLDDVRLRAGSALLASSTVRGGQQELTRARIVDTRFDRSEILACGSLRLLGASLESSFVTACDSPLVVAGTAITRTRVHGTLEVSGSSVTESVLAPGPGGTLLFTDSTVRYTALCDTEHFIASSGEIACVRCTPDIPDAIVEMTGVHAPECPALEAAAAASMEM